MNKFIFCYCKLKKSIRNAYKNVEKTFTLIPAASTFDFGARMVTISLRPANVATNSGVLSWIVCKRHVKDFITQVGKPLTMSAARPVNLHSV